VIIGSDFDFLLLWRKFAILLKKKQVQSHMVKETFWKFSKRIVTLQGRKL
jgi:hypothetical protein